MPSDHGADAGWEGAAGALRGDAQLLPRVLDQVRDAVVMTTPRIDLPGP